MVYQKKTVDDPNYARLNWYKDEKYKGLEKLSDLGWYFQILVRRELVKRLDTRSDFVDSSQKQPLDRMIDCVRVTPVVTLQSIKGRRLSLHSFTFLAEFLTAVQPKEFVRVLNFDDMIGEVEAFLAAAESIQSPALKKEYEWWMGPRWNRLIERAFSRRELLRERFASSTLGQLYPGLSIELLRLDLGAPDRVLRANFNSLLKRLRQTNRIEVDEDPYPDLDWKEKRERSLPKKFWSIEPEMLLSKKLIQYMDLIIWEKQRGLTITPLAKASLLFGKRKLQRKRRRKSMRSPSAQNVKPEVENKNKKATNGMDKVRPYANVIMNGSHPANDLLHRRAAMELNSAYLKVAIRRDANVDSDFVMSPAEKQTLKERMRS